MAYYRDKLGFDVVFVSESDELATYAVLSRDGAVVHLFEDPHRNPEDVSIGMNVAVEDVDAFYREFQGRGAFAEGFPRHLDPIREHGPENKEYGMRGMIFVDPFGFVLVFGQPH